MPRMCTQAVQSDLLRGAKSTSVTHKHILFPTSQQLLPENCNSVLQMMGPVHAGQQHQAIQPEAEFLDVIGKKVLRVVLLDINSHLYRLTGLTPPPPPHPLSKSGLNLVCYVNIVFRNLKSENSQDLPRNLIEIVHSWIRLLYGANVKSLHFQKNNHLLLASPD